jgi:SET domain-containing protein
MPLLEKQLFIKGSKIPVAGKGLFTKKYIAKGSRIAEYKGRVTTWNTVLEIEKQTGFLNRYLFFINKDHVIDATNHTKALARYANDARGLTKIKGLVNNCRYVIEGPRVFMEAINSIPAGAEIFISYGKEYWDVVKQENKVALNKKQILKNENDKLTTLKVWCF